jgi:hypothetical protein
MRAFLRFLINLGLIALVVWAVVRFTTLDDKIIAFFTKSPTVQTGQVSCKSPWGSTIPNGSTVFAYKSDIPGSNGCEEEKRTCKSGVLDGTYVFASCMGINASGDVS